MDKAIEAAAQKHVSTGDGAEMGLRFLIAEGIVRARTFEGEADTPALRSEAVKLAYEALRAAITAYLAAQEHDYERLVKQLRTMNIGLSHEAADAIELLIAEIARLAVGSGG